MTWFEGTTETDVDTPSTCYVVPYVLCQRDISKIVSYYQRVSPRCVCECGGGGGGSTALLHYGGGFTYKGSNFCWDIRANYATKSTVAECVIRL